MSEHVPLPTGGIGRECLSQVQGLRRVGGGLPHMAKCRVSPRASCRELSVGSCRCVVLLWLCTPALFLLVAACHAVGGLSAAGRSWRRDLREKAAPARVLHSCSLRLLRRPGSLADVGGASPALVGQFRADMPCRLAWLKTRMSYAMLSPVDRERNRGNATAARR